MTEHHTILLLILMLCGSGAASAQVFHIKPENATAQCPDPCVTLNEYAQLDTSGDPSIALEFLPGVHILMSTLSVVNKVNSTLQATSGAVTVNCDSRGSLVFENVVDLQLLNLTFLACSSLYVYGISIYDSNGVILSHVTISNSLGGPMSVVGSSVQMSDVIFANNKGDYSSLTASYSELFFGGNCTFQGNAGNIAGFSATSSNLTFHGDTIFTENTGNVLFGLAGLSVSECNLYNFGSVRFLYNSNPQVLSVNASVVVSEGLFEFVGNTIGPSQLNLEATLFITNSTFTHESFIFTQNQGSAYFFYSPFVVTKKLQVTDNILIQNYPHATFTLQGSTVDWTGDVTFRNNQATEAHAGIQSIFQDINVNGSLTFIDNHAHFSTGLFLSQSKLQISGTLRIRNNSASIAAVGLTLIATPVHVNGFVSISENTASSDISAVLVAQLNSVLNVTGSFEFLNNRAVTRAFSILFAYSTWIVNGQTVIRGSIGDRPTHFFEGSDVTFAGETEISDNYITGSDGAGLGLSRSVLRLEDTYSFFSNRAPRGDGGAIYAIDSTIVLNGNGNFTSNTANRGGAIHLFYRSRLAVLPGSSSLFSKNTAANGGAVHVENVVSFINCTNDIRLRNQYAERPTCFFDADPSDTSAALIFDENEASESGTALYGGMLNRCQPSSGHIQSPLEAFMAISQFTSSDTTLTLSSDPFRLCFCENDTPNCATDQMVVQARRGAEFTVSVMVLNELDVGIVALVRSYLVSSFNDTSKTLGDEGILQRVDGNCTDLKFRVSSASDAEQLTMYAESPCGDVGNTSKSVLVQFQDCPVGFVLDVDTCLCDTQLAPYTNTCNVDTGTIEKPTDFWVGVSFNGTGNFTGLVLYPNCPFDYCLFPSPSIALTSPDTQCNFNRSGVLCGACGENTSLLLGSSDCSECSNYYLFLLIPFALMGVLLVAGLFLLQLTVATGALHGLIFYANIVTVNKAVLVPAGTFKGFSIFLSWLNLDFGIETCFFSGMNQYAKTWLQFAFPAYLLSLVLLIIIVCHYSTRASRFFGSNPVAVLATIVLLSYTKILRNIINSFAFATLEYSSNEARSAVVWLFDGNLEYARNIHAVLFAFSLVIVVVLVLPYTLVLLTAQVLMKIECISSSSLFKILIPFIDACHAPYKVTHRYWIGLFLIVRSVLLVTFAVNFLGDPGVNLLAITTVCFCTGSLSWIIGGVYSKRILDTVEALFILNLGLFAAATYHNIGASDKNGQAILADISLCFALILFISVVGVHIYHRLVKLFRSKKAPVNMDNTQQDNGLLDVSTENYGASGNNPTVQIVPAPHKGTLEMSYSRLRESLLEDN